MRKTNSRLRKLASGKRSKLEERVSEALEAIGEVQYEPDRIPFVQPSVDRYYVPDFKLAENVYVEVKGRLTIEDRKKMLWVTQQNPHITIYFIFGNASNKLDKRSKTTYREWAQTNGFECTDVTEPIPRSWFRKLEQQSKEKKRKLSEGN